MRNRTEPSRAEPTSESRCSPSSPRSHQNLQKVRPVSGNFNRFSSSGPDPKTPSRFQRTLWLSEFCLQSQNRTESGPLWSSPAVGSFSSHYRHLAPHRTTRRTGRWNREVHHLVPIKSPQEERSPTGPLSCPSGTVRARSAQNHVFLKTTSGV